MRDHEHPPQEAEEERGDLLRAKSFVEEDGRQHRRPQRRQPDEPSAVDGARERETEGLQELVHEHAHEAHQGQPASRVARGNERLAAGAQQREQQRGA